MQVNKMMDIVNITQQGKPFGPSELYRERHADVCVPVLEDVLSAGSNNGVFSEPPSKLASDSGTEICQPKKFSLLERMPDDIDVKPEDLSQLMKMDHHGANESRVQSKLWKPSSFSCDLDREEAWKRKRDLYLMEQITNMAGETTSRTVGRSASDCNNRTWPRSCSSKSRPRTRSLTDEDLEELRGCIDLGFGFTFNESSDLRSTLPALDLYYAINRQYNDIKCRSPVSTLDDRILDRSFSGESACSSFSDTWKISSPGDHPNQVKTRLRHWAQAVACSIRESF